MHTFDLIYNAIRNDPDKCVGIPENAEVVDGNCCFTGKNADCISRKFLLGKSFTNQGMMKMPESDMVSVHAWTVLKYRPQRVSSFYCDGEIFERLDRLGVREKVFSDKDGKPWIGYATTSYKKHGSLATKINFSEKSRTWTFETRIVNMSDTAKRDQWWEVLNKNLRSGISRPCLETLEMKPAHIRKVGLETWLEFTEWAKDKYQSAMYVFLCYLLPSKAELQMEMTPDLQTEEAFDHIAPRQMTQRGLF